MKIRFLYLSSLTLISYNLLVTPAVSQQPSPLSSETPGAAKPEVKTGKINENQQYKSGRGMFSVTVPAAGNPFVRTYESRESQLKDENYDYDDVVFYIADFGQAYGAGVRRIPQAALAQMAKEEEKQTLSTIAGKTLFQWRSDFAEEPQAVEEFPVQTQFGGGLLRVYLAKRSSLLTRGAGKSTGEKFDAYIAVMVVKQDDSFVYATVEDDYLQTGLGGIAFGIAHPPSSAESSKAAFVPQPDLRRALRNFFASINASALRSVPLSSEAQSQQKRTGEPLNSVAFATLKSGWAVGLGGTILHTEDGGGTWITQVSGTSEFLHSVTFATPQLGWAVGNGGTILQTEDGGGTWKLQASGTSEVLDSVAFTTPQSGWAVGGAGIILHTEDGGRTWKPQSSGTSAVLNSVAFATPQSGWAVGDTGIILHTEDGGRTWNPQSSGTSAVLNSVAFATPQSGWAVGYLGTIVHTEDGGVTWKPQASGTQAKLESVAFVTPQSGWAVVLFGTILHTEDGGHTWMKQSSGVRTRMLSVAFTTPQSGWVVGGDGIILHTEDGGGTWKK